MSSPMALEPMRPRPLRRPTFPTIPRRSNPGGPPPPRSPALPVDVTQRPDLRIALDDRLAPDARVLPEHHPRPDARAGTDDGASGDPGPGAHLGVPVNQRTRSKVAVTPDGQIGRAHV